jgi:hypothetical protein
MRFVHRLKSSALGLATLAVGLVAAYGPAHAQQAERIRGEIESVAGNDLTVKTPDGKIVAVALDEGYRVTHITKASLSDIKPGDFVGTGALPDGDAWKAAEVHIFPKGSRQGEGHRVWSSDPSGTMTNADVTAAVVGSGNGQLTLTTHGQSFKINVPPDAPVVKMQAGTPALIKKGAWIGISNGVERNGKLTAKAITVSDDRRYPVR